MSHTIKKIVVFPASGWQGRSVLKALSQHEGWEVVGIVRNLDSPKLNMGGINIKELPVTLVQGDFADPTSYERHFEGADAAFINTDFWSIYGENGANKAQAIGTELQYSQAVLKQCQKAKIKHLVWSSLYKGYSDTEEQTGELYDRAKFTMEPEVQQSGIPYTLLYNAGYYELLQWYDMLKPQDDGSVLLSLFMPDSTSQQFTSVAYIGAFVRLILEQPDKFNGKRVMSASEEMSWGEVADRLTALGGKKVKTPQVSHEAWNSEGLKQGLGEMWTLMDLNYRCPEAFEPHGLTGRDIVPDLPTFDQWARTDPYVKEKLSL